MRVADSADFLLKISKATSDDDLSMLLSMLTRSFGFEHFSFWVSAEDLNHHGHSQLLENWPDAFDPRRSDERRWYQAAFVRRAAVSQEVVPIDAADVAADPDMPIHDLLADTKRRDFALGLRMPIWHRNKFVGLAIFIGRDGELSPEGATMLHMLVTSMHRNRLERANGGSTCKLTEREREVLHWTAAGKTAAETAIILGLSARTVEFLLRRAAERMGTVNRTHTVAEALRRGLL